MSLKKRKKLKRVSVLKPKGIVIKSKVKIKTEKIIPKAKPPTAKMIKAVNKIDKKASKERAKKRRMSRKRGLDRNAIN